MRRARTGGMDALGASVVGCITALGGGTARDALFLARRPFWVEETECAARPLPPGRSCGLRYLWIAGLTGLGMFLLWPRDVKEHPVRRGG